MLSFDSIVIIMPVIKSKPKALKPTSTIVLSFLLVIVVGALLLSMPFSSKSGEFTNPITCLFTATSATCVTGLIIEDTGAYWSVFGQIVIILMIQIGGLGLVTLTSFFSFFIGRKLELRSMQIASESVSVDNFSDVKYAVKNIIRIAFAIEFTGAILLMFSFVPKYGLQGIYFSFFIAISAFCNAGFDVIGGVETPFASLMPINDDPIVMLVVPLLIIFGGMGFIVWTDLINFRKTKKLMLQSKIVLSTTAGLIIIGTLLMLICEWNNPNTLGDMEFMGKLRNSFFQSVTFRTAGFASIDITGMHSITKLVGIFLMFIGVAPGSTGGGIKITTFMIVVMTIISVIKNKSDTIILGHKIEKDAVYKSLSIIVLAGLVAMMTAVITIYSCPQGDISGIDSAFEAVSAFSTTGLSSGVTAKVGAFARIILSITMFIGRVGPISFAMSLTLNREKRKKNEVYPEGKIMVG